MFWQYRLFGADATDWLQGQITQDLSELLAQTGKWFALCTPTGHIQCAGVVWTENAGLGLAVDAGARDVLESRVRTHVILEDVQLEAVGPAEMDASFTVSNAPENRLDGEALFRLGFPIAGKDYDGKVLCSELGEAFLDRAVSFTKGCYPGQEIIQRIKTRGHTNRTWRALETSGQVAAGDTVSMAGAAIGAVNWTPAKGLASAILRNEVEVGAEVLVNGFPARVRAIPLS